LHETEKIRIVRITGMRYLFIGDNLNNSIIF